MNCKAIYLHLLLVGVLLSAPVDINKAQRVASNIYAERTNTGNQDGFEIRSVDIISNDDTNLIYIFNLASNGFILVSADDKVQPLLAYSFENNFELENAPSNLLWMFDSYKQMVKDMIESDYSSTEKIYSQWEKYYSGKQLNTRNRNTKGPLFVSRWDQSGGWNDFGPPNDDTCGADQAPSGCVAVSMSSIMHYWQYPPTGNGSNSCYCGGYGTQYADFTQGNYDYASMGDAVSASSAAAYLVWHAGVAVNMDYECEGSGAQVTGGYPSAQYALENNFLFRDDTQTRYRSSSSDSQWINYLITEIDNNRPMIYVGYNDEGGHAWNCDGYDDELFHMNWGWGGSSNGWFTVTESGDPDGWGSGSHILANIQPESLNRPNLLLSNYTSNELSGDGDMVVNPGEAFELFIELENPAPWSYASSIEIILSTNEEGVNIDSNTSSIISNETLQSGGIYSNSNVPFIIDLDDDVELGVKTFNLMVIGVGVENAEDNFYFKEYEIDVLVSLNQYGFPMYEASQKTSPLAVDFDGDGEDEIIFGDYNGFIHILNLDGTEIINDNFPFDTGNQVWGSIAGSDMDGDGLVDIAVVSKSKHFYLLDINGVKVDIDTEKFLLGTPAIGNLDGDSDLEVVFSGYSSNNVVWALNPDGSSVNGFPVEIGEKVKIGVALADFNGNGKDDIVVGTDDDHIHLIYDDGSMAPNFPFVVGDKVQSAPSILDIDGQKVIFAGSNDYNFYAINSDGSLRFSVETTDDIFNSASFLNHNNEYYIFFSDDNGVIWGLDTEGNNLSGWPVDAGQTLSKSIVFSDLDNNGIAEVIALSELTDIVVYNLDGSLHDGFPMDNEFPFTASPMVMDMDSDGDLEILGGSVNSLVSIDVKTSGSSNGFWNMYRGSIKRTGYYDLTNDTGCADVGDLNADSTLNVLDIVLLANCVLDSSCSSASNSCAGDVNDDGGYNILDIVSLVNLVLGD
tara:strand:+ start:691 stop:3576 length:2886 start_codon:yes stop_codon:yes gene_type:complete